ncbi:MAG TPA: glycosyl transferase family A [Cyanobacteria bacterium UBA8553]|nr:glycosyl transferase family A [Cyanobacteria bacterium UBA8553]HAJ60320.1 glycosyl transferase family A [Cyanobacteria bacterium UBA8543]
MPTISVIIPAYNAEKTILETITSVIQQTYSNWEMIVINDGSTDRTLELLSTVKDARIKIFSYPNGGVPVARNHGLNHATGDFIAFLDADDLWTPDKLELQLAKLQQHPEAGVVYSWAYYMDETGESFHADNPIFFEGNVYAELLVRDFIVSGSNCTIRRQAIESVGKFDPSVPGADDWDYWLRLALHWPFVVVPKLQIFYRQSSGSVSSKVEAMENNNLRVIEKGFQSAPPEMQNLKNQSLANTYRYSAHLYLTRVGSTDSAKQAAQKLWMAIRLYPRILRDSWTRNLLIKVLLIQLISPKMSSYLFKFISQLRATRDPNLQQSRN